jgi:RNA polymerase sigma-70 factor (ECF subfamily)
LELFLKPNSHSNSERLEQAFDRYYPALFRYFRYRGADADTANDLASATFERALKNLAGYDPRRSQIQTWLFAIARNLSINHWKAASNHTIAPLDEDMPIPDDPPLEQAVVLIEDKEQILSAVQTLDERAREILALKFGGPLTNRQIAGLTGLTESNVGIILYRSLLKLRTLLTSAQMEARDDR